MFLKRLKAKMCPNTSTTELVCAVSVGIVFVVYVLINMTSPTLLPKNIRFPARCRPASSEAMTTSQDESCEKDIQASTIEYGSPLHRNYAYFLDHSWIPRMLNEKLHRDAIQLMYEVSDMFRKHNITYILNYNEYHDISKTHSPCSHVTSNC